MCGPGVDNPTYEDIERRNEDEKAVSETRAQYEQMKAQMEEAAAAAKHAEELAREASMAAEKETQRLAQEAQAERERSQKISEEADRAMAAMRMEAYGAQKAADEQRHLAEEKERIAAEETKKAKEAMEDAERRLKDGIQPIVTPTPEEVAAAKQRIQYKKELFHFAVAGRSGSGKSSLVNAFRGLCSMDKGAAAVGVTETTLQMKGYAAADYPVVWYDVPGAGTSKCSDWQYFNDQGLYVFDCIIVLFDDRFTETDLAILKNARRFHIPTYIVRSKADQHVSNVMREMDLDEEAAREHVVDNTRKNVTANLEEEKLPDQPVYVVSVITLREIVKNVFSNSGTLMSIVKNVISNATPIVKANLEEAKIPDQPVNVVSVGVSLMNFVVKNVVSNTGTLMGFVKNVVSNTTPTDTMKEKVPKQMIDELKLVNDLIDESRRRRKVTGVHGVCKH